MTPIEGEAPRSLHDASLTPRGRVHPSPAHWRDQTLYFLLPDRFSDGRESERPPFDRANPDAHRVADVGAWMEGGTRFQGGTIRGIIGQLDYLKGLGVTTLWIGPVWKQRADLHTYHGYGIQDFLEVDPRFGTRQDLRDLVDAAHERGLYVLLDIIFNHTGNNFFYERDGQPVDALPYQFEPPHPVFGWRGKDGQPVSEIADRDDGVWPVELQNLDLYTRAGSIGNWDVAGWEDPLHEDVEFRRGDFFDLKDVDLDRSDAIEIMIAIYQYWIALSDCDGFRIDTVKHMPLEAVRRFCEGIREYAESIGKENFWLLGEVAGGDFMKRSYLEIFGRNLDAVLDFGVTPQLLKDIAKGLGDPKHYYSYYTPADILGSHRETGRFHVTILDDHDQVGAPSKARFAAGSDHPLVAIQLAHAVGMQLCTLGIPCIYYGTEQAFNGSQADHDHGVQPDLAFADRYIRESMFGGTFGAFKTAGCHFFDPSHPTYLRIAAIARVRNRADGIGLALRRGREFAREISYDGAAFFWPGAGDVIAWSRILHRQAVICAFNTHGDQERQVVITVDAALHPPGQPLRVLYRSNWSDDQLRQPPEDETAAVEQVADRFGVRVTLPPAGMIILG